MTIGQFIESSRAKQPVQEQTKWVMTLLQRRTRRSTQKHSQTRISQTGSEVFYNGTTGENSLQTFSSAVLPKNSPHGCRQNPHRTRGQVQMLTRQPAEGRAEVVVYVSEKWNGTLIGHGAAMLLRDRLLEESDKYTLYICENCGQIAYFDMKQRRYVCKICDEKAKISPVNVLRFKLLLQELRAYALHQIKTKGEGLTCLRKN
jgi:DNA-directed RNA polymerase subunit B